MKPPPRAGVLPLKELVPILRLLRRRGKRVAFTNGCFDLLHAGHLDYLQRIKRRADVLVVGVNSDSSARRLKKGAGRPWVPARERARLVAALKPVDFVTIFSEATPIRLIRSVRPDLLVKGADWPLPAVVGREFVESHGGRAVVMPLLPGHSTTRLIRRIRRAGR